jgi:hypothetical protein
MIENDSHDPRPDSVVPKLPELDSFSNNPEPSSTEEMTAEKISRMPRLSTNFHAPRNRAELLELLQTEKRGEKSPDIQHEAPSEREVPNESATTEPRIRTKLGMIDKISLAVLCLIFVTVAFLGLAYFYEQIPTRPLYPAAEKFPKSGQFLDITSLDTYWRKPIEAGENRDAVKLGTVLIPVLNIGLKPKQNCGILVLFRDEQGKIIGDQITRSVTKDNELSIAASAGMFDLGSFQAYLLNDELAWTVEILEGKSTDVAMDEFVKVFETKIAAMRSDKMDE